MVPNLAMTVCHAPEGSTASNLGWLLQLMIVRRVTTALQRKTFVIQIQAASCVHEAIFAQLVLPILSVVAQELIKVVCNKCLVMIALKVTTALQTPLFHWSVLPIITVLMGHTHQLSALLEHLQTATKLDSAMTTSADLVFQGIIANAV